MLVITPIPDEEFKQMLLAAKKRRLQELELQDACQGLSSPPHLRIEIEALLREMRAFQGISPPLHLSRELKSLREETQRDTENSDPSKKKSPNGFLKGNRKKTGILHPDFICSPNLTPSCAILMLSV